MAQKRRNGFDGERLVALPEKVCRKLASIDPKVFPLYVTEIGYFPRASFHYRERRKGCTDNILIYCLQGIGHYVLGKAKYEVKANQYVLLPATSEYMRYWADIQHPWTIYWIHFTGSGIQAFNRFLHIDTHTGPVPIAFNQQGIDIWMHIYRSLETGYSDKNLYNANFQLYSFIATFLFPGFSNEIKTAGLSDTLTDTIGHMRAHIHQKITLQNFADRAKVSTSFLSKLFRRSTGMAPIDYFIYLKMQKACQLLYSEGSKIREVAMQLGYDDQYYFSRLFKKVMGTSPEQYRLLTKTNE